MVENRCCLDSAQVGVVVVVAVTVTFFIGVCVWLDNLAGCGAGLVCEIADTWFCFGSPDDIFFSPVPTDVRTGG